MDKEHLIEFVNNYKGTDQWWEFLSSLVRTDKYSSNECLQILNDLLDIVNDEATIKFIYNLKEIKHESIKSKRC